MKKFTNYINESIQINIINYNGPKKKLEDYWMESIESVYRKYCNYSLEMLLYVLESLSKGREVEYTIGKQKYKYRIKEIFIKVKSKGPGEGINHSVFFINGENEEIEIPQDMRLDFHIVEKKRLYSAEDPLGEEDWDD